MSTHDQRSGARLSPPRRRSIQHATIIASLSLALALPSATTAASGSAVSTIADTLAATHEDPADYAWDTAAEVELVLDGSGDVTIDEPGAYRLRGNISDGGLVVESDADGTVWLILDGVDISNSTGAAIAITAADKTVVWLADGSDNTLSDAAEYVFPDASTDEPNAALFSADDLTIAGSGSLTVEGNYNDGISSKDGLVIAGGDVTVTAVDDGIRGKDYLVVGGGTVDVIAGGDALKSDEDGDASLGFISISGGSLDLAAGADAVEAVTAVLVSGGDITLAADDDGIHSEAWLEISGGSVDITGSYEGLEGTQIVISGGATSVIAEDDGLNVSDGNGSGGPAAGQFADELGGPPVAEPGGARGQRPGAGGPIETPIEGLFVEVSGGTLVIDANGDGFESNGVAAMSGGTIVINGPTTPREGAIDVNGEFLVSGGTLLAAGSVGMVETPSASSAQATLDLQFGSAVPAGTVVRVVTGDGTAVATYEAQKATQSLVLSTPDLVAGETYEVLLEGTVSGDSLGGLYLDADYSGGTSAGTTAAV